MRAGFSIPLHTTVQRHREAQAYHLEMLKLVPLVGCYEWGAELVHSFYHPSNPVPELNDIQDITPIHSELDSVGGLERSYLSKSGGPQVIPRFACQEQIALKIIYRAKAKSKSKAKPLSKFKASKPPALEDKSLVSGQKGLAREVTVRQATASAMNSLVRNTNLES